MISNTIMFQQGWQEYLFVSLNIDKNAFLHDFKYVPARVERQRVQRVCFTTHFTASVTPTHPKSQNVSD